MILNVCLGKAGKESSLQQRQVLNEYYANDGKIRAPRQSTDLMVSGGKGSDDRKEEENVNANENNENNSMMNELRNEESVIKRFYNDYCSCCITVKEQIWPSQFENNITILKDVRKCRIVYAYKFIFVYPLGIMSYV